MKAEDIFLAALEQSDLHERAAYLDRTCGSDAALRTQVEGLLRAHVEAGNVLDQPLFATTAATSEHSSDDEPSLSFLGPPAQPEHLGRLGHYEVHEVVGRGGMGIVLKALDEKLHRVVAIKVMAAQLATCAAARKLFCREAQAAAAVSHDHIVTIHAVEEAGGLPYLVMQYVSGHSLQERLDRDGPMRLDAILRIGMQTASGLAAAHAQGLIHRDIKPANILLENGVERVKITDFGLARAAADAGVTQTGMVAGSPHFMSPEQARGETLDQRSDLFSLGGVLYVMCTGRTPFRGSSTVAVLKRVCEDQPTSIREVNSEIPDWLAAIIERLHAKDPADRFQSAAEVAQLLSQHLAEVQHPSEVGQVSNLPTNARQVSNLSTAAKASWRLAPRGRRWALAAVAAVILLFVGLGLTEATGVTQVVPTVIRIVTGEGTLVVETDPDVKVTIEGDGDLEFHLSGGQTIRVPTGPYRIKATKDGKPVPLDKNVVTISRGGRVVVKVTHESPATAAAPQQAWIPPATGVLDALDPANILADQRFDWQPKELVQVLGTHDGRQWDQPTVVVYTPDGKLAASAGYDGHIYVWDAETLRLRRMLPGHGLRVSVWGLAFFPDSQRLLSGGDDNLARLWDVETGNEIRQFKGHSGHVWGVAVSHDGLRVLTGAGDNTVRLWGIESEEELHRFNGHTGPVTSVVFSPDGLRALSGSADSTMRLWDLERKTELHCFDGHADDCRNVRFLHDGHRAISCSHDHTVRLWNLETGEEIRKFLGHTDEVYSVDVSHDGRRAVSTGKDGTIRVWDVDTGAELFQLKSPSPSGISSVVFSPDGTRALSGGHDSAIRRWDLDQRVELHPGHIVAQILNAWRVAISQDGRRVLACMANGVAWVWDTESGRRLQTFEKTGEVLCATLTPDGRHVLCGGQHGLTVWSVETGQELRRFVDSSVTWHIVVSPDGRTVLTGDHINRDGYARIWKFDSGQELFPLGSHWGAVYATALSSDGRRALSGGWDKTVRYWDLESASLLHQWQHTNAVWSVALSSDGRFAATSDDNGFIQLRDLSGAIPKIQPLPKVHTHWVRAVAFSPDSRHLASAGYDGRILVWDVASGTVLRQWQLPGFVGGVSYAADGRHLVTVNANATVYILRQGQPDSK